MIRYAVYNSMVNDQLSETAVSIIIIFIHNSITWNVSFQIRLNQAHDILHVPMFV